MPFTGVSQQAQAGSDFATTTILQLLHMGFQFRSAAERTKNNCVKTLCNQLKKMSIKFKSSLFKYKTTATYH